MKSKTADTTVMVRRQFLNSMAAVGVGAAIEEENKTLEVRTFATEPAKVSFEGGVTANMGNYESVRISVGVTVPCYYEELEDAYAFARKFATDAIAAELKDLKEKKGIF